MYYTDGFKLQVVKYNFTGKEISDTTDSLKKSADIDPLPAELTADFLHQMCGLYISSDMILVGQRLKHWIVYDTISITL